MFNSSTPSRRIFGSLIHPRSLNDEDATIKALVVGLFVFDLSVCKNLENVKNDTKRIIQHVEP